MIAKAAGTRTASPITRRRAWRQDPEGRRLRVLDAAARSFGEHGYQAARVDDIARAAGVAEGTVYNLFGTKDRLLRAVGERYGQGLAQAAFAGITEDLQPEDAEGIVRRIFGYVRQNGALLAVFLLSNDPHEAGPAQEANRAEMVAAIERTLRGWMRRGLVPPMEADIAAELQFGLVESALKACYLRGGQAREEAYIREAVRSLLAMVRLPS